MTRRRYPLPTRDPITGGELIVTRLRGVESGVSIEGEFSLGWIARLTPEQLDFVHALVRNRGNVQKLAVEIGVAYNTARARLDDIVGALGGPADPDADADRRAGRLQVLERLQRGEIDFQTAMQLMDTPGS